MVKSVLSKDIVKLAEYLLVSRDLENWKTYKADRSPGRTAGTNSLSQSVLQKYIELRRNPSANMIGRDDGLIKDEDKDVENTMLAVVTRGNTDPEGDFNSLVEFVTDIQSQYQNRITSLSLTQLQDEARRESSLKVHINTLYITSSYGGKKDSGGSSIASNNIKTKNTYKTPGKKCVP